MLDSNFIRENPQRVKENMANRQMDPTVVDDFLAEDTKRRDLLQKVESLRAKKNALTKDDIEKGKELKKELKRLEPKLKDTEIKAQSLLLEIPNMVAPDVPVGRNDTENVVARKFREPTKFAFTPKDHLELGESLGYIDIKRAGKVSGDRFWYLTGDLVLLELSLFRFAFDVLCQEGFIPVIPPALIKKEMEAGLGYGEHGGWDDMYILERDNLVLVATAEHTLITRFAGETFTEQELPLRFVGVSTAFRREAGTYGKDTRGILRGHQFNKVEMVSFAKPEDSEKEHEYLLSLEEKLMQTLELPYEVVKMCTGDLGAPAARKYDINAWLPGQNSYRETHSCSNCTDYQARRLNIKFRRGNQSEFVHILNGTAFPERPLIAILENYQQADGSIKVPEALRTYMHKDVLTSQNHC